MKLSETEFSEGDEFSPSVLCITHSALHSLVAIGLQNSRIYVYDTETNTCKGVLSQTGAISALVFSPNEKCLISAGSSPQVNSITVWKLFQSPSRIIRFTIFYRFAMNYFDIDRYNVHEDYITCLRCCSIVHRSSERRETSSSFLCVSGARDSVIKSWSISDAEARFLHSIQVHTQEVTDITFSADGKYMFSASKDGFLGVFRVSLLEDKYVVVPLVQYYMNSAIDCVQWIPTSDATFIDSVYHRVVCGVLKNAILVHVYVAANDHGSDEFPWDIEVDVEKTEESKGTWTDMYKNIIFGGVEEETVEEKPRPRIDVILKQSQRVTLKGRVRKLECVPSEHPVMIAAADTAKGISIIEIFDKRDGYKMHMKQHIPYAFVSN